MMYRYLKNRRRSAQTDYRKRIALLKGGMPRLVIRKSNKAIAAQIIEYSDIGDKVLASANSKELKQIGWEPRCNIPTAYLTGMLLAKKIKENKSEFVLDTGLYRPIKGSVIFAAAKGFKDNGANLRSNIEFDEKRLQGTHIETYAKSIKETDYNSRFSSYVKSKFDARSITEKFQSVKAELMK
jgi:large subunit ribosomal protein L18